MFLSKSLFEAGISAFIGFPDSNVISQLHPNGTVSALISTVSPSFLSSSSSMITSSPSNNNVNDNSTSNGNQTTTTRGFFFLSEDDNGFIASYDLDQKKVTSKATVLGGPAHLGFNANHTLVGLASYGDGSISIFTANSSLIGLEVYHQNFTSPTNDVDSHPHEIVFNEGGDLLFVPDLGLDVIHTFTVNGSSIQPSLPPIQLPHGTGPRHMILLANTQILLVGETSNTLYLLSQSSSPSNSSSSSNTSNWEVTSSLLLVDDSLKSPGATAELYVNGTDIYISQRFVSGTTSAYIAHIKLNETSSSLSLIKRYKLSGQMPRYFTVYNERMFVLLQDKSIMDVFDINVNRNGSLGNHLKVDLGKVGAECIIFI